MSRQQESKDQSQQPIQRDARNTEGSNSSGEGARRPKKDPRIWRTRIPLPLQSSKADAF